ncbi:hypothetical protein MRX96_021324 [Rhipicephalus microplus]
MPVLGMYASTGYGGVSRQASLQERVVMGGRNISVSGLYDQAVWAQVIAGISDSYGSERLHNELGAPIYDYKCSPQTATLLR